MQMTNDLQLIDRALAGNREAYGQIVERYQALICSLTYSACGDLARSEDLAQETFLTAWKQLGQLKDRDRLKAWLCGIARNLCKNFLRTRQRQAADRAVALDPAQEPAAATASPGEQAIGREEEALTWETLETIPEIYREPLVLFYRQDQSVAEVAEALDLSQDATKQRLSRGRAMLKERVAQLVETTLSRSRPSKAFTIAALAALPALSAEAAAAGMALTAAKGSTAAKTAVTVGLSGAIIGPIVGLLGGFLGARASIASARSPRERRFMVRLSWWAFGLSLLVASGLILFIFLGKDLATENPKAFGISLTLFILFYLSTLLGGIAWASFRLKRIQEEERDQGNVLPGKGPGVHPLQRDFKGKGYRSNWTLLGLPLIHIATAERVDGVYKRGVAKGWIAIGDISFGVLFSLGGIAFGGVAIGGVSLGLISLAGLAVGGLALGGGAIGWLACGGGAVAWYGAFGGLAVASEFAMGGLALADQANTEMAKDVLMNNPFMSVGRSLMENSQWFMLFLLLPVIVIWKNRSRKGRAES